jgi:hypothetical protein
MADEVVDISDDARNDFVEREDASRVANQEHIQRSRLRVDTRKWLLSKCLPKIYGDRPVLEAAEKPGMVIDAVAQPADGEDHLAPIFQRFYAV